MEKGEVAANERFRKALELQDQGVSRNEIYAQLGYSSIDSLTRYMRKQGYKYSKEEKKYVKADSNTTCNTNSNTTCNIEDSNSNTKVQNATKNEMVLDNAQIEVLNILQEEQHTLLSMLEWYKQQVSNTCNTNSNTLLMTVNLPKSENVIVSSRANKEVWAKFKEFTKKNNDFTACDLLSQALVDFMNKYS